MVVHTRRFEPGTNSHRHYNSDTGSCSIEFYNACKDTYRVAPVTKIPVPWPYINKKLSNTSLKIFEDLEDSIRKELSNFGISAWTISISSRAAQTTPEKMKDMITIRTHDEPNLSWKLAAFVIHQMVEKEATPAGIKMRVEIQNSEKMYTDVSSVIRDEGVIEALMKVQPVIKEAVMDCIPGKWTSIAYQSRGPKFEIGDQKPTIIVFIAPGSIHPWLEFEKKTLGVIQSARLPDEVDIALEILPGRILPDKPQPMGIEPSVSLFPPEGNLAVIPWDGAPITPSIGSEIPPGRRMQLQSMGMERPISICHLDDLPVTPSNGAPIAPSLRSNEVGSAGAVVNFYPGDNSERVKCFLTCYNVVASGDPAGREVNDQIGIGLNERDVDCEIDIDYPAKYEAIETKHFLTHRIEKYGDKTEEGTVILKRLESITAGGPIGHVKYASGYQLNTANRRMDWALVALRSPSPGDSMQNKPPLENKVPMAMLPKYAAI